MCENLYNKLLFHCYQCWFVFRVTLLFQEERFRHTSRFIFICWHFHLFFHTEGCCHFLLDSSPKDNIRQPKMVRFFLVVQQGAKTTFYKRGCMMVYYPVTLDLTKTNRGMNSFTIVALLFFLSSKPRVFFGACQSTISLENYLSAWWKKGAKTLILTLILTLQKFELKNE